MSAPAQIIINEILANSQTIAPLPSHPDYFPDYIELYNNSDTDVDLGTGGWRIGDSGTNYIFTAGTVVPARGYLLVFCDDETTLPGVHTRFGLSATKGETVFLILNSVPVETQSFGIQAPDLSIGRIPDVTGAMQLNRPTPGVTNTAVAVLGDRFQLKINEWLATNSAGAARDWFEIYNPDSNVVSLAGIVFADRGSSNAVQFGRPTRDLSFIAPFGFVQIFASDKSADADEVRFGLSGTSGDDIWIFNTTNLASAIDVVSFSSQAQDTSEGRLPDGGPYTDGSGTNFKLTNRTPGESNFGPIREIVINEVLAHVDPPLEDAIELYNPMTTNVTVGGWWLSDNRNSPKKYQIPAGTIIPAGEFKVFYEYQFNGSNPNPFNLNSAHGGEVYLFKASPSGELLGFRRGVDFGASENGVSFGRWVNSQTNADIVPMSKLFLGSSVTREDSPALISVFRAGRGASNQYPRIGPIVISEVHYHPPDIISGGVTNDITADEFIELHNFTSQPVPLYDPVPVYSYLGDVYASGLTNTWRIRGGDVSFDFPENITLGANRYLLVVNFSPTNTATLNDFTNRFGIGGYPTTVQIFGPYDGRLGNGGSMIELRKPDAPQGPPLHNDERGFVPYVYVDGIDYDDKAPWPVSPDGQGHTLQRRVSSDYGNEPANWKGAAQTAGRANSATALSTPNITTDPSPLAAVVGSTALFTVAATGSELSYRWLFNGIQIHGATNATLTLENVTTNLAGAYRALVINAAGSDTSAAANLTIVQNLDDTTIPTVAFTSPANNARVTASVVTISGTARDNLGVGLVELQVNGGAFEAATGLQSWSKEVTLVPGPNILNARSTDLATNLSVVVSRTINYVVVDNLNLSINGEGSVSGATIATQLEVGKRYTLTAKPATGFVFSNWTGDVSGVSPALSFTMDEDLDIAANFVPNPFTNSVAGTFNGLFHEEAVTRPESAGYFSFKLTTKGSYTAQLLLTGKKYSAKGVLNLAGQGTNTILRTGLSPLTVAWQIAFDGSDTVTGTISDGSWTANLAGDRLTYHASLRPSPFAGRYTFVVPATSPEAPEGDSYAAVQITTAGQVIITGSLAENIKLSQKTTISKNGEIPLYFAPYTGRGLFTGWLDLDGSPATLLDGNVTWIKPAGVGGTFYLGGFTNDAPAIGSSYSLPSPTVRILPFVDGALTLTGANLAAPLTNTFSLGFGTITNTGLHTLTLKFTPASGLFSGTLKPTNTTTLVKFNGVVVQNGTNASGYFSGTNKTGRVSITDAAY